MAARNAPSAAAAASVPASKDALLKSYRKRLKEDIGALTSNFKEIINLCKVEDESNQVARATQCEEDAFEMQVRAAHMVKKTYWPTTLTPPYFLQVRAGESLIKLISDIKQFLILNDFPSVNEAIAHNSKMFLNLQESCDSKLTTLRDEMAADLYELEEEYYSSQHK